MSECCSGFNIPGICHIATSGNMAMIEANLVTRLSYGLLTIGAWTDVTVGMTTPWGGNLSLLISVCDPAQTDGMVWQAPRQNWVYETEVVYDDMDGNPHSPITPAITVNGGAPPAHSINHVLGQVIFDAPIPMNSIVEATYSFKNVGVIIGDQHDWWTELQRLSWRVDESFFTLDPDCDPLWRIAGHHLVQMPVIVINGIPTGSVKGFSIGGCKMRYAQDILIHILAENKSMVKTLIDVIFALGNENMCTFNCDEAAIDGNLPLDCGGSLVGAMTLPELLTAYPWSRLDSKPVQLIELHALKCGLYESMLRIPTEMIICAGS